MAALLASPRRAWLVSFWSVMTGLIAVGSGALAWLLSPLWTVGGVGLSAAFLALGLGRPSLMAWGYGVWSELDRYVGRVLRLVLVSLCYFVVLLAVGWTGTSVRLTRMGAGQSLWETRSVGTGAYFHPYRTGHGDSPAVGWVGTYVAWARQTGNAWAIALLPFLALLSIVDSPDGGHRVPTDIYTVS